MKENLPKSIHKKEDTDSNLPREVEVKPKSPEVLQAQVAAFAASRQGNYKDRAHIFDNLGSLAAGELKDATRVVEKVGLGGWLQEEAKVQYPE
jgi:hypothetical protein